MLKHLAEGNLEQAAALSNAPKRRFEVLRDYRDAVGPWTAFMGIYRKMGSG